MPDFSINNKTIEKIIDITKEGARSNKKGENTGNDLLDMIIPRPINLIPNSSFGCLKNNLLEPDGMSEYFTREQIFLNDFTYAMKYTCIKDIEDEFDVLIFTSGESYPEMKQNCSMLISKVGIGNISSTENDNKIKIRVNALEGQSKNITIWDAVYVYQSNQKATNTYYTSYFIPREIEVYFKIYVRGPFKSGDTFELIRPWCIGYNQFESFSFYDIIQYDENFSFSPISLEEYAGVSENSMLFIQEKKQKEQHKEDNAIFTKFEKIENAEESSPTELLK